LTELQHHSGPPLRAADQGPGQADEGRRPGQRQGGGCGWDEGLLLKTIQKDPTRTTEEALKDIYMKLRPGDPPTTSNAKQLLKRVFFDPRRYDLSRVGRYKIEQKLGQVLARCAQDAGRPRDDVGRPIPACWKRPT
jgi:hypothetical protein